MHDRIDTSSGREPVDAASGSASRHASHEPKVEGLDVESQSIRVSGKIKWFDATRGFGFVVVDSAVPGLSSDVLIHVSVLRRIGFSLADEGAKITCRIAERERGWQVVAVDEMDPPRFPQPGNAAESDYERVLVKWFNTEKGYGFVRRPADDSDIFLHIVALRAIGLETVSPGEELKALIDTGPRGVHVVALKAD